MASVSNKYIMEITLDDTAKDNMRDSKKVALRYSFRGNLDPLLAMEKSLIEHIPVLHIKEGKA